MSSRFAVPIQAQTQNLIQVEPTFQEIVISDAQATGSGQIKLVNSTNTTQLFEFFAVDIQQFNQDGQIVLADKPLTGSQYSLANFIQLQKNKETIAAGQSLMIPFTVQKSQDITPGGHYAAVVARMTTDSESKLGKQQVLPAVSSFVLLRKEGGEVYHLSLLPPEIVQHALLFNIPKKISLTFSNQGNTHMVPRGTVEFTDIFGKLQYKGIVNENSSYVFPSTQREIDTYIQPVDAVLPLMFYTVKIAGHSEPGNIPYTYQTGLMVIQPIAVITLVIILILLVLMSRYSVRHFHHLKEVKKNT